MKHEDKTNGSVTDRYKTQSENRPQNELEGVGDFPPPSPLLTECHRQLMMETGYFSLPTLLHRVPVVREMLSLLVSQCFLHVFPRNFGNDAHVDLFSHDFLDVIIPDISCSNHD